MKKLILIICLFSSLLISAQSISRRSNDVDEREMISFEFDKYLSSAQKNYKKDANKAIDNVTKALLLKKLTSYQKAKAYANLGEIQFYWKQYDLAIDNFKSSLTYRNDDAVKLKLGESEFKNETSKVALKTFKSISINRLKTTQQIILFEQFGDIYTSMKKFRNAENYYNKALKIAEKAKVEIKITDLNSKLGKVKSSQGNTFEANSYFKNSLNLSSKNSPKRFTLENERVADFYNLNKKYDKEIALRKKNLITLKKIDGIVFNPTGHKEITAQGTNFKIANAYVEKAELDNAIPYLKKSIALSKKKNDLVIQKQATQKLSEISASLGNHTEALKNYQSYVKLVDKLYLKKEKEIENAIKFNKEFTKNQQRISSLENARKLSENKLLIASKNSELTETNVSKQRIFIYALLGGLLLLCLLIFFMYRNNKQQKINNNLLALRSLRSQMNPHFIFNALNSVNSFIASNDERAANRYLSDFSKLMRSVLENSEKDFISLESEIELLQRYIKLEHFRFQDKFDYTIEINKTIELDSFSIPPMLLQPYVENAVWHGLRYKEVKGLLKVIVEKKNEELLSITIEDNGIGREKSKSLKTKNQQKHKSKGLGNINKRIVILNEMYKGKVVVAISDVKNGGTKVELTLKKA